MLFKKLCKEVYDYIKKGLLEEGSFFIVKRLLIMLL